MRRERSTYMSNTPITVIDLCVASRDGWFYASASKDLPELHVCGKDRKAVMRDACLVIKKLYKLNRNMDVTVTLAAQADLKPVKAPTLRDHLVRLLAFEVGALQPA